MRESVDAIRWGLAALLTATGAALLVFGGAIRGGYVQDLLLQFGTVLAMAAIVVALERRLMRKLRGLKDTQDELSAIRDLGSEARSRRELIRDGAQQVAEMVMAAGFEQQHSPPPMGDEMWLLYDAGMKASWHIEWRTGQGLRQIVTVAGIQQRRLTRRKPLQASDETAVLADRLWMASFREEARLLLNQVLERVA